MDQRPKVMGIPRQCLVKNPPMHPRLLEHPCVGSDHGHHRVPFFQPLLRELYGEEQRREGAIVGVWTGAERRCESTLFELSKDGTLAFREDVRGGIRAGRSGRYQGWNQSWAWRHTLVAEEVGEVSQRFGEVMRFERRHRPDQRHRPGVLDGNPFEDLPSHRRHGERAQTRRAYHAVCTYGHHDVSDAIWSRIGLYGAIPGLD